MSLPLTPIDAARAATILSADGPSVGRENCRSSARGVGVAWGGWGGFEVGVGVGVGRAPDGGLGFAGGASAALRRRRGAASCPASGSEMGPSLVALSMTSAAARCSASAMSTLAMYSAAWTAATISCEELFFAAAPFCGGAAAVLAASPALPAGAAAGGLGCTLTKAFLPGLLGAMCGKLDTGGTASTGTMPTIGMAMPLLFIMTGTHGAGACASGRRRSVRSCAGTAPGPRAAGAATGVAAAPCWRLPTRAAAMLPLMKGSAPM